MKSKDGETMKQWTARSGEIFDKLSRKTGVQFPDEAKGWVTLYRSGLTDEQRAVIISRSGGDLKHQVISKAMRSCYPDLVISKKKAIALVEDEALIVDDTPEIEVDDFQDVDQLLEDHNLTVEGESPETFQESDIAEVLAASWRDKRSELNKLQKARQFNKAREVKRSFRVEIEELKRRTACHKCGKKGHWARECRSKGPAKGQSKGSEPAAPSASTGVAMVQTAPDFVAAVESLDSVSSVESLSLLDQVRRRHRGSGSSSESSGDEASPLEEVQLVSSPGFGVLDSGCGRTIVGQLTLNEFERLWLQRGIPLPPRISEMHQFRFGNGEIETSHICVNMPVRIAGKQGTIRASVVQGTAPLLISRSALKTLGAQMNFKEDTLTILNLPPVPLQTNSAGQYVIDVLGDSHRAVEPFEHEIMMAETNETDEQLVDSDVQDSGVQSVEFPSAETEHARVQTPCVQPELPVVEPPTSVDKPPSSSDQPSPSEPLLSSWTQEDCQCAQTPWLSRYGPKWKSVRERIVRDAVTKRVIHSQRIVPGTPQHRTICRFQSPCEHVVTEFRYVGDVLQPGEKEWTPSTHQFRQLASQLKACASVQSKRDPVAVMEVFSPPRFALALEPLGYEVKSYDLKTGYDFTKPADRKKVEDDLDVLCPELLVLCPPCTDEGGWFFLNQSKWDRLEYLHRVQRSRMFIRWCCKLFRKQVASGRRAIFEHPTGAKTWTYAEMMSLCRKHYTAKLHMCRYNLRLPGSDELIRKSTRVLVSDPDMTQLEKLCPGPNDPQHAVHDTVQGSAPGIRSVSAFTSAYTPEFVQAVLRTIPKFAECFPGDEVLVVEEDSLPDSFSWDQVDAVAEVEKPESEVLASLSKLHRNLGHPPNADLIRILRHGQASDQAVRLAKTFSCEFCKSRQQPSVALPAQPSRVSEFNHQIGIDVKQLPGWQPNQKIKALNIVDTASSFQRMIPFFEQETASLLRKLLTDHWTVWTGPPKEIVLDAAQTNLGAPMVVPAELDGIHIRQIAADAHWQLGKTESHGGWFTKVLEKLIDSYQPSNREEWLECVVHAHVKNQMIQVHGFTPCQFVFGKNPHIPTDLLNEPLNVIPATASLTEEGLAKTQSMRTTARKAILEMQDDRAMRVALLARPRRSLDFRSGDLVAYWRSQKWEKGKLVLGGKWHGTAIVMGHVGRNLVLLHRRQILRCAPEQVRHATQEEKTLITSPEAEMLGIKDLITKGNLESQQFLDLVSESYPSVEEGVALPRQPPERAATNNDSVDRSNSSDMPAVAPPHSENVIDDEAAAAPPPPFEVQEPTASANPEHRPIDSHVPDIKGTAMPSSSENYGPVRSRRIHGKDGPMSLWRPAAMHQDDVVSMLREVVPQLVDKSYPEGSSGSSSSGSQKRPHEEAPQDTETPAQPSSRQRVDEVLSVQDCSELFQIWQDMPVDVLVAEYIKKKMAKELHHSNNPPEVQDLVQEGKRLEWETLLSKENAIKIHYGKRAREIHSKHSDRFIGSRFVLTRKPHEEGIPIDANDPTTYKVKGRWCLQGHLDPDLTTKAAEGLLKSPTLSQIARMTLMQVIASHKWDLQLGDIRGAFLEAGPIEERFRPLYAHQPPGGIPGLPPDAVIEVVGNMYGQNNAPSAWFQEFVKVALDCGWIQSKLDPCLFTLRDSSKQTLVGVMGVHVDDTAIGGEGPLFEASVQKLRKRFPYRKWRINEGEFCGAWYKQHEDKSISMNMSSFVDKIRSVNIPKGSQSEDLLNQSQMKVLRAVNGSLNWLASQSRPDLSCQTSFCQQSFPNPRVADLRKANQAIRRAKLDRDLCLTFKTIKPEDLTVVCHSDAAFANVGEHTQAGFVVAFTESKLQDGHESQWCPAVWRSHRLTRAVGSTLAAEAQSMCIASGTAEWILLLLAEVLDGPLDVRSCRDVLKRRRPLLVTDCKSLYDHLTSPSSPTSIEDKRTSIDVVIIRESCRSMEAFVRWVPTNRMLADAFTKDAGDPTDLLRSCIRHSMYQISPEETVLEFQALEKELRMNRKGELNKCPEKQN